MSRFLPRYKRNPYKNRTKLTYLKIRWAAQSEQKRLRLCRVFDQQARVLDITQPNSAFGRPWKHPKSAVSALLLQTFVRISDISDA